MITGDLFASSRDAMVVAGGKISKCRSQLFAAWEQLTVYLRRAQNALVGLGRNAAEILRETFRARMNDTGDLFASSHDPMVVAGGKISKCRSQLFAAWEQLTRYIFGEHRTCSWGWVGTEPKYWVKTFRARMNDRRDLFASSRDAMVVAGGKISKCRSQLFAAWEQLTVYLRQALNALAGVEGG